MKSLLRPFVLPAAVALVAAACGGGEPAPTTAMPAATTAAPHTQAPAATTSSIAPITAAPLTTGHATTTTTPATFAPTSEPPATTAEPGPLRIKVDVYDGLAQGEPRVVVERGEEVELVVTSDAADEVHLHGYDLKADVTPDAAAVIRFVANLPGIYEVELEDAGLLLVELEVR